MTQGLTLSEARVVNGAFVEVRYRVGDSGGPGPAE